MRRSKRSGFGDTGFEAWGGYMGAKKAKLADQFDKGAVKEGGDPQSTAIFQGVSIFVNGYTVPSAEELKRIMMVHGGQFHHYYSCEKTKFIIASNLADTKVKRLKGQPKVVKPAWISECVSAGRLLDHRPYLLYSNQSRSQPGINFPVAESFGKDEKPSGGKPEVASSKPANVQVKLEPGKSKKPRYVALQLETCKTSKKNVKIEELNILSGEKSVQSCTVEKGKEIEIKIPKQQTVSTISKDKRQKNVQASTAEGENKIKTRSMEISKQQSIATIIKDKKKGNVQPSNAGGENKIKTRSMEVPKQQSVATIIKDKKEGNVKPSTVKEENKIKSKSVEISKQQSIATIIKDKKEKNVQPSAVREENKIKTKSMEIPKQQSVATIIKDKKEKNVQPSAVREENKIKTKSMEIPKQQSVATIIKDKKEEIVQPYTVGRENKVKSRSMEIPKQQSVATIIKDKKEGNVQPSTVQGENKIKTRSVEMPNQQRVSTIIQHERQESFYEVIEIPETDESSQSSSHKSESSHMYEPLEDFPDDNDVTITETESNAVVLQSTEVPSKPETAPKTETSRQKMGRAGEPNFLSEFYNHSRLHHISTMGSMFKKYVSDLRKEHDGKFPGRLELMAWKKSQNQDQSLTLGDSEKIIMHIDMDCFFVSVGLRSHPELRGLPVAVTHAKGNPPPSTSRQGTNRAAEFEFYKKKMENKVGKNSSSKSLTEESALEQRLSRTSGLDETSSMSEIASCSYEARKLGLKNGMFLGSALKLCPNLKTIPYDFEGYKEVSFTLYNTVASFTLDIEAVSCDEMFVDCTSLLRETRTSPLQFATFLRGAIKKKTGCPASTGFGGNILQARLATKRAKPDGQFHLLPPEVSDFMQDIKVEDLPGVGRNLAYRLHCQQISTCSDLQKVPLARLQSEFGQKTGLGLQRHCRGQDERSLDLEHLRKSVSAEVNYGIRFSEGGEAKAFVRELAAEVQSRLEEIGKKGRCVTLKLMVKAKHAPTETAKFMGHGVCDSVSRSTSLATETCEAAVIAREAITLLVQLNVPPSSLRGMGIQVSKLTEKASGERSLNEFFTRSSKPLQAAPPAPKPHEGQPCSSADTKVVGQESVDQEFLDALPEDLREEIMQNYERYKQYESLSEEARLARESGSTSTGLQEALSSVTFSQVDPGYLNALPENLRKELISDLQQRQAPPPPPTRQQGLQSPSKTTATSPRKGKYSPRAKGKQILTKGQQKINMLLKSPSKSKETEPAPPAPPAVTKAPREEPKERGGVLSTRLPLDEALGLVREWVDSEGLPQPVDRELFSDLLQRLVAEHRLDKLDALLRTLHRKVEGRGSASWEATYHRIVADVQLAMLREFGAPLKVALTFH